MKPEMIKKITSIKISSEALRLAEKYGYEPYIIERYLRILGRLETLELLEVNETPLPETIRCNDYLISCKELVERLESKGFALSPLRIAPHGIVVHNSPISVGATHEYLLGYYYVQDPASMLPVYELEAKINDLILDMAAAPGGKATQILQLTRNSATLVAVDVSKRRIRALRSNLSRMGFSNYVILLGDSRFLKYRELFDKILLDAPSSGEGIIRKDPTRKRSRSVEDLKKISSLQIELLRAAIKYLKPGGILVYAACTLAVEEGELVISTILSEFDNISILDLEIPHVEGVEEFNNVKFDERVRKCGRLYPHIHGTEGFFICKIKKKGN